MFRLTAVCLTAGFSLFLGGCSLPSASLMLIFCGLRSSLVDSRVATRSVQNQIWQPECNRWNEHHGHKCGHLQSDNWHYALINIG